MSTTAGYFDETLRLAIRARASELRFDDRINLQYIPQIESMKAIMQNETTKVTAVENPKKDDVVEVEWINACGLETRECDYCNFDGTQLSTNIEQYSLDLCREVAFEVPESVARTNDFNHAEFVAKGFLAADKLLNEWFNQQILTELNAAKGVNVLAPGTNRGCIVGSETYITAPYWNAALFAYFQRVAERNRFGSPYLVSGSNLHEAFLIADYNKGNADGKGEQAMFGSMKIYFDEHNIDTLFDPILYTFMINRGSIALANKARYEGYTVNSPKEYRSELRHAMTSQFSNLKYDVHYTDECDSDTDTFVESYKVILRAGVFFNPTGCDDNNTGMLSFQCDECPS